MKDLLMTGTSKTTDKTSQHLEPMNTSKINPFQHLIAVYCFAKKKNPRFSLLWDKKASLLELSYRLVERVDSDKPIFFDRDQAFIYGRYIDNSYCIVKAYVWDQAIESKNQNLHLRKQYLQDPMIHGCYPSNYDARIYIKNKSFNEFLLQQNLDVNLICDTLF